MTPISMPGPGPRPRRSAPKGWPRWTSNTWPRTLHGYPAERLATAYRHAREDAADETGLPLATFPEACPWPLAQVLDEDFWPEA
jgi:hypothetical protein